MTMNTKFKVHLSTNDLSICDSDFCFLVPTELTELGSAHQKSDMYAGRSVSLGRNNCTDYEVHADLLKAEQSVCCSDLNVQNL